MAPFILDILIFQFWDIFWISFLINIHTSKFLCYLFLELVQMLDILE